MLFKRADATTMGKIVTALAIVAFAFGCEEDENAKQTALTAGNPKVVIDAPTDGSLVGSTFEIDHTITDWNVQSGGAHFNLFVDGVDQGPRYDATATTVTDLAPGSHTITLKLANADQTFTGVEASSTVTVAVPGSDLTDAAQLDLLGQSNPSISAADQMIRLTSNRILDEGSGGTVTAAQKPRASRGTRSSMASPPGSQIEFQSSLLLTLDLDDIDPATGADAHPNVSGVVTIDAEGSVIGNEFAGIVSYNVSVTVVKDVTFTDPETGGTATVAAGAVLTYTLVIEWDKTDNQNVWFKADAEASITDLNITLTDGQTTVTVKLVAERHVTAEVTLKDGVFSLTATADGFWDLTITSGTESHNLRLDIKSASEAYVIVDGQAYGPFNAFELQENFGIDIFENEDDSDGFF